MLPTSAGVEHATSWLLLKLLSVLLQACYCLCCCKHVIVCAVASMLLSVLLQEVLLSVLLQACYYLCCCKHVTVCAVASVLLAVLLQACYCLCCCKHVIVCAVLSML